LQCPIDNSFTGGQFAYWTYEYNGSFSSAWNPLCHQGGTNPNGPYTYKITQIVQPSGKIVMRDITMNDTIQPAYYGYQAPYSQGGNGFYDGKHGYRPNRTWNGVFADGHVENIYERALGPLRYEQLPDGGQALHAAYYNPSVPWFHY
jgi:prepilin-type processing-associated H-X9-DG protein